MAKTTEKKINKQELISLTAEKSGLTKVQAKKAVDGVVDVIKEALSAGGSVSVVNFGSFKAIERKARVGRNLQTGERIKIKAKTIPKFIPGKGLREAVKG